jgi:ribosomal protein S18 acetylase RimI-like enzyme
LGGDVIATSTLEDLYKVTKDDVKLAARMWAITFQDYPLCAAMEPDSEIRRNRSHFVYEYIIKLGLRYGMVYAPSKKMEGVAVWLHSDKTFLNSWQMLLCGALNVYLQLGRKFVERMERATEFLSDLHKELVPYPHMNLYWLGVDSTMQRKGIGSILVRAMLAHLDQQRLPCFLETQKAENVAFYKRYGFEIIKEGRIPEIDIPTWSLLRKI